MSDDNPLIEEQAELAKKRPSAAAGWINFLVDFGPLLVFFLVFRFTQGGEGAFAATRAAINGTVAFMVAIIIAVGISKWRLGKVSPMLWLSAVLIIGFGTLTVYFNDPYFIQIKPTIIYAFFAAVLFAGLLKGKAMLKYLLQAAFDGLTDEGWLKLSRNWAWFFVLLAIANTIFANNQWFSFEQWVTIKTFGFTTVSFLFTLTQIPLLLKHGLSLEEQKETPAE